jgi:DNA-binding transcriptional ArsR family regulator
MAVDREFADSPSVYEDESQDFDDESTPDEPEPAPRPARKAKGTKQPVPRGTKRPAPKPAPEPEPEPTPKPAPAPKPAKSKSKSILTTYRHPANRLKLVADATRASILALLVEHESLNVGDICNRLDDMSQPAVSHHLALLRHGQLIQPDRQGKHNYYSLTNEGQSLGKMLVEYVAS